MPCGFCNEDDLLNFFRRNAFNIGKKEFKEAIVSTRNTLRNNGRYKQGMFFKTIFDELNRDVDWRTVTELENEFMRFLK